MSKPITDAKRLARNDIVLTPLSIAEIESLRQWRAQDDIRIWFFNDLSIVTPEAQNAWFTRYQAKDDDVMFVIRTGPREDPVGAVALYNIDLKNGTAEYGRIMIGEASARGTGVAAEASRLLCEWAFDELGLRSIFLWVFEDNRRAIALYERLGFRAETPPEPHPKRIFMKLPCSQSEDGVVKVCSNDQRV